MSLEDETRAESTRSPYKRHRYPAEIIAHCVWLYYRFTLSLRDVEELMLARGIVVSHETIRTWCAKSGPEYAGGLRRRASEPGDTWFLDEVFVKIGGIRHYLWRAVDQDGNVLDVLVQSRRNAKAAKRFFGKLMRKQGCVPRVLVTDTLASYVVAHRELMPSIEHRRSKYLNNRAENSHQPARQRERAMKSSVRPVRHRGFWRYSVRSRRTCCPAGTSSLRAITARKWPTDSLSGTTSPAYPPPELVSHQQNPSQRSRMLLIPNYVQLS